MNSNKLAEKTGKTKNYMHVNGDVVKREQNNYFHSSKLDKNNAEYIRNNSDLSGLKNDLKFSEKNKTYNDESGLSQTDRFQNEVNHNLDADNSDYATVDRIQVEDKVGISYLSKEEIISKDFSALSQMDKPQIQALETNHDRNYEIYDGDNHFDVDRTQIEDETIDLHSWKEVNSKKKQADKSHNQVRPENTNFDKNSKVGVEESRDYSNIKSTKVEDPRNDDDNNFPETADFSETNFPDVNKEQVTADEFIVSNLQNNNDKAPNSDLVMKPNKELDKSDTFKVKTDKNSQSDRSNEDSDDIITGDQRRAMQELEKQQEEINCSGEKTSDSSVKERLRQLNQELAELPLTESKHFTKVGFRTDLVEAFSPTKEMLENESVNADNKKGHMEGGEELLVERDGQFEIINSGDITASQITGGNINNNARDKKNPVVHAPLPPAFPRPKTANEHLIRASRSTQHHRSYSSLSDCTYISPYGLTPEEKQMSLKKKMEMDERRKAAEQQRKNQQFIKDKERAEAFQVWLKGIKAQESAEKKKQSDNQKIQKLKKEEELSILEKQRKEAFENWRKQKEEQKKQEKLLKQREEEELLKLHPSKSKKDCDNAFRIWLSQKNWEAKRQKAMDVQKYRLQVLFLHRAQKLNNLFWGSQQYASKDYKYF